jgi:hypothetical protein
MLFGLLFAEKKVLFGPTLRPRGREREAELRRHRKIFSLRGVAIPVEHSYDQLLQKPPAYGKAAAAAAAAAGLPRHTE